jgi:hypothetical protein
MSKKTIIVLLVSLALASVRLVEGAVIGLVMLTRWMRGRPVFTERDSASDTRLETD